MKTSPYFAPAASWERTRDLPLSVEFRVVPTRLPTSATEVVKVDQEIMVILEVMISKQN